MGLISKNTLIFVLGFFLILGGSSQPLEKALVSGWNLVSAPVKQGTNAEAMKLFEGGVAQNSPQPSLGFSASRYVGISAVSTSVLTPGEGHWVWAEDGWTLKVDGEPNLANPILVSIRPGWNLVGNPFENPLSRSMVFLNWEKDKTLQPFEGKWHVWENDDYQEADSLAPWQGAWVLASQETHLAFFSGYLFEPKTHTRALLTWPASSDPNVVGYNIYKDGVKVNDGVEAATSYMVGHLEAGREYVFQVMALDRALEETPLTPERVSATFSLAEENTGVIGGRVMKPKTANSLWTSSSVIVEPVASASVVILGTDKTEQTDAWGYFEFQGISPGDYTLEIQSSSLGMGQAKVSVQAGKSADTGPIVHKKTSLISAGRGIACAVRENRKVYCWGKNNYGQLGNGILLDEHGVTVDESGEWQLDLKENHPVEVVDLNDVVAVSVGEVHACALKMDGSIYCWGSNQSGRTGIGKNEGGTSVPMRVNGIKNAISLDLGTRHACALDADGKAYCWGYNLNGQLGIGNAENQYTPVSVLQMTGGLSIGAGSEHTCLLKVNGTVYCWGARMFGQLGDGKVIQSQEGIQNTGIAVPGVVDVEFLSIGFEHSCVKDKDGGIDCWGDGFVTHPGTGERFVSSPRTISDLDEVDSLSAGSGHTCVINKNEETVCWGSNACGELGNGASWQILNSLKTKVVGLENWIEISAGAAFSCAVRSDLKVFCWGCNDDGELGDGTMVEERLVPTLINF